MTIVPGGANMERPMGAAWLRGIGTVDLVVTGEGDRVFPTLLVALSEGRDPAEVPGVLSRGPDSDVRDGGVVPPFHALDTRPVPDYDEFYERLRRVGLDRGDLPFPRLIFEASRGCWWGEKIHCTFCGLNGTTMAHRTKSPARVLDELDELAARYDVRQFAAADNILGREHVGGVLDELAPRDAPYDLFFELKAPEVVVAIGVGNGGTFFAWCQVAAPSALLVGIDLPSAVGAMANAAKSLIFVVFVLPKYSDLTCSSPRRVRSFGVVAGFLEGVASVEGACAPLSSSSPHPAAAASAAMAAVSLRAWPGVRQDSDAISGSRSGSVGWRPIRGAA